LYADQRAPNNAVGEHSVNVNRTAIVAYRDGIVDVIVRRIDERTDKRDINGNFYPEYKEIDTTAEIMPGQIYRVVVTETDNFGINVVADDLIVANTAMTCDESNRLLPVTTEICFWRTHDYGTSWYQVREPYVHHVFPHAHTASSTEINHNYLDSGYLALFLGVSVPIDDTTKALDHTEFALFIDKVQI
jgi:hypothetical protein